MPISEGTSVTFRNMHFKFRYVGLYRHLGVCDQLSIISRFNYHVRIRCPGPDLDCSAEYSRTAASRWIRLLILFTIAVASRGSSIDPIAHQVSSGDNLEVQRARMPACTLLSDCTRTVAAVRLLLTPDARRRQPCAASFCDPSTAAAEYTVNGDELDYQRCRLPTT